MAENSVKPTNRNTKRMSVLSLRGSNRTEGFSLIELLVAVAVISVLGSIVFASFKKAGKAGNAARCVSNLRQIGVATQTYLSENNNVYYQVTWWDGQNRTWMSAVCESLGVPVTWNQGGGSPRGPGSGVLVCPSDPTKGGWNSLGAPKGNPGPADMSVEGVNARSYIPNSWVFDTTNGVGKRKSQIASPSKTILFTDFPWYNRGTLRLYPNESAWYSEYPTSWHNNSLSCLFADGHVEMLAIKSLVWGGDNARLWYSDYPTK